MKGQLKSQGIKFTDRDILKENYNVKIHTLKIWFDDQMIKGLQAIYQMSDGKILEGKENAILKDSNFTLYTFQLEDFDYLKALGGAIGEKGFIEYLYFASCNGKKGECGQKKEKQKNFALNVLNSEVPICLYGFLTTIQGKD